MAHLDHVALLVQDLEATLGRLDFPAEEVGPIEEFPGEGTREIYLGQGSARLLLLQPLGTSGPYARAMEKRGPGLHHVALHTPELDSFLGDVRGWLLHPASIETIARWRTAWLARPGVPTLVEVHEAEPLEEPPCVSSVEVPAALDAVSPAAGLSTSVDGDAWITARGRRMRVADLARR